MKWYYMRLGTDLKHGLVDDEELHAMASRGDLGREDLIWGAEGGSGWVQAESLHDLFTEEKPKPQLGVNRGDEIQAQQQAATAQKAEQKQQIEVQKKKSNSGILIMVVVCIAAAGLHFRKDIMLFINPAAYQQELVDSEMISEFDAQAETQEIKPDGVLQLEELFGKLQRGELNAPDAKELMDLWFDHSDLGALPGILIQILDTEGAIPESVILSVMNVGAVLNDTDVMTRSLNDYKATLNSRSSSSVCVQFAFICAEKELEENGASVLNAYLDKNPKSAIVWFELAAVQVGADNKSALEALKTAYKLGGDDIKEKAIADERFDPVNSSAEFQKITRD